jgi:hypothetical protein
LIVLGILLCGIGDVTLSLVLRHETSRCEPDTTNSSGNSLRYHVNLVSVFGLLFAADVALSATQTQSPLNPYRGPASDLISLVVFCAGLAGMMAFLIAYDASCRCADDHVLRHTLGITATAFAFYAVFAAAGAALIPFLLHPW